MYGYQTSAKELSSCMIFISCVTCTIPSCRTVQSSMLLPKHWWFWTSTSRAYSSLVSQRKYTNVGSWSWVGLTANQDAMPPKLWHDTDVSNNTCRPRIDYLLFIHIHRPLCGRVAVVEAPGKQWQWSQGTKPLPTLPSWVMVAGSPAWSGVGGLLVGI